MKGRLLGINKVISDWKTNSHNSEVFAEADNISHDSETSSEAGGISRHGTALADADNISHHGEALAGTDNTVPDYISHHSKTLAEADNVRRNSKALAETAKQTLAQPAKKYLPDQLNTKDNIQNTKNITDPPLSPMPPKRQAAQKRATRKPADFSPTEKHQALAAESGLNLAQEFLAFSDYHLSKGSVFVDWNAALNTWLRNSVKFAPRQGLRQIPPPARLYNHIPEGFRG